MCGLVACITKTKNGFNHSDLTVFGEMLFADTLRGKDSTGVFGVNTLGNVHIVKDAVTAEKFLDTEEYKALKSDLFKEGWAVVGHNRKATRGEINNTNSHPFWVDDKLVLVHNGSYNGDHKKLADTEVDSHAIAIHLANNIEDYEKALQKVNAAYALMFYDVENRKLNIIRNKERPLYKVETNSAYFFASEWGILSWILTRNSETIIGKIEVVEENKLHTFQLLGNSSYEVEEKKLDCSFRWPQPQTTTSQNVSPAHNSAWWDAMDDTYGVSRYAHACGYMGEDYDSPPVGAPTPKMHPTQVAAIQSAEEADKEALQQFGLLRDLCVIDPSFPRNTHGQWAYGMKEKTLAEGTKFNVIVDDWVYPDGAKKDCYLKGKTLTTENLPVIFKIDHEQLQSLMDSVQNDNLLFEIEVDRSIWKRDDKRTPMSTYQLDSLDGVVFIIGRNHKVIQQGTNNGQTH